ncbi:MAG: hypothetical protein AB7O96_06965 [Pseudobdellovibrionaceae bacterium]
MDFCDPSNHDRLLQQALLRPVANLTTIEIEDGLTIWRDFFQLGSFLELNDRFELTLSHNGGAEVTPLAGLILSGHKLRRLQGCTNFQEVVGTLQNITQFHDTLFEVDCAFFFLEKFRVAAIEFSPDVIVAESTKRPDFRITFDDGYSLLCECKNMSSVQRIRSSKLVSLLNAVDPHLAGLVLPPQHRLEIFFERLPRNYRTNLGEQLVAGINVLLQSERLQTPVTFTYQDTGDQISFCINPMTAQFSFRGTISAGAPVNGADTFRRERLQRIFTWKDNRLETAIGGLFNKAKKQIPTDQEAVLFIKTIQVGIGQQAATERCLLPEYANILAFGVWAEKVQFFGQTDRMARLNRYRR